LLNCLQRGQVEALKLYLLFLGFRLLVCGRQNWERMLAGFVLSLPVVLKLTPLLPVACIIVFDAAVTALQGFRRNDAARSALLAVGFSCGLAVCLFVLPALLVGWNANLRNLETWYSDVVTKVNDVRTSDFGENVTCMRNQSFDNAVFRFGNWFSHETCGAPDDTAVDHSGPRTEKLAMENDLTGWVSLWTRVLALGCLLLVIVRASASGDPLAVGTVFGLACAATVVVCPVARGHYFALLAPAVLFHSLSLCRRGQVRTARILAVLPAVLIWLHYVLLPLTGRIGLLGLGTTAWYFASCIVFDQAIRTMQGSNEIEQPVNEPLPLRLAA
jgi:hypothetical protein